MRNYLRHSARRTISGGMRDGLRATAPVPEAQLRLLGYHLRA
jgi:hypothetical protein